MGALSYFKEYQDLAKKEKKNEVENEEVVFGEDNEEKEDRKYIYIQIDRYYSDEKCKCRIGLKPIESA